MHTHCACAQESPPHKQNWGGATIANVKDGFLSGTIQTGSPIKWCTLCQDSWSSTVCNVTNCWVLCTSLLTVASCQKTSKCNTRLDYQKYQQSVTERTRMALKTDISCFWNSVMLKDGIRWCNSVSKNCSTISTCSNAQHTISLFSAVSDALTLGSRDQDLPFKVSRPRTRPWQYWTQLLLRSKTWASRSQDWI